MQKILHITPEGWEKVKKHRFDSYNEEMQEYMRWKRQQRIDDVEKYKCVPKPLFC